jgi:hypothetical protein
MPWCTCGTTIESVAAVARHQSQSIFLRSAFAVIALFTFAMMPTGCSAQKDSSARGESANDYIAQGPNDAYAYGFGSYDPCMAYDPYCSVLLPWYLAHAHYYSRGDSDNDCDDRNRGGSGGASHHEPAAAGGGFRGGRGGRCR